MLWVSADPGCGKSVLVKYLVDSILPTTESRTTCCFFKDNFDGRGVSLVLYDVSQSTLYSRDASCSPEYLILERFEIEEGKLTAHLVDFGPSLLALQWINNAGEIVYLLDAIDEC